MIQKRDALTSLHLTNEIHQMTINAKSMSFPLGLSILISGCSTATEKSNTLATVKDVAAISASVISNSISYDGPTAQPHYSSRVEHLIQVSGLASCSSNSLFPFSTLAVEFIDEANSQRSAQVQASGIFESSHTAKSGKHVVRLIEARTRKVLDQKEINSSETVDRFDISLNACPNTQATPKR